MLPALVPLAGSVWGVMVADDRGAALAVYLGLFGFAAVVALMIVGVLGLRNRRFLATASVRISDRAIECTDARGRVVTFDRADPSVTALLAWVPAGPNSEGINLPPSLIVFLSDGSRSLRRVGSRSVRPIRDRPREVFPVGNFCAGTERRADPTPPGSSRSRK